MRVTFAEQAAVEFRMGDRQVEDVVQFQHVAAADVRDQLRRQVQDGGLASSGSDVRHGSYGPRSVSERHSRGSARIAAGTAPARPEVVGTLGPPDFRFFSRARTAGPDFAG